MVHEIRVEQTDTDESENEVGPPIRLQIRDVIRCPIEPVSAGAVGDGGVTIMHR